MNKQQKRLALEAWLWCEDHDKSTEFAIQFMADKAEADVDDVADYIISEQFDIDLHEFYESLE